MEEKIYFKPADYGAGRKKEKKEKPEKKNHKGLKLVAFLTLIATIIIVVLWLLRGKTTISGQYPANVRNESLICESNSITYEKVNNVNSDNKELKISMVFNDVNTLSSASLKYVLHFASSQEVHDADAISHAQFNIALQNLGYDSGKFNNKFSEIDNDLVITLNLSSSKGLDDVTRSYFLIEYTKDGKLPKTLSEYQKNYESQGFSCTPTVDNN